MSLKTSSKISSEIWDKFFTQAISRQLAITLEIFLGTDFVASFNLLRPVSESNFVVHPASVKPNSIKLLNSSKPSICFNSWQILILDFRESYRLCLIFCKNYQ